MGTYWASASGEVPSREFSWWAAAGVVFSFVSNIGRSVSVAAESAAVVAFGAANRQMERVEMVSAASREIEALTSGLYWEVDGEDGVFVADLDEFDEDDVEVMLDEEDE